MKTCWIACALLLGVTAASQSAPLDLDQVAAEAAWVVHLDGDAARASSALQRAYQKLVETNQVVEKQLDLLRFMIGMDPRKDLHGITVYGKKLGKNDGVLILHADVDRKLLLDKVKMLPDHEATRYRDREIHSWTDAKGKKNERPVAGVFHRPTVVVFAPTVADLKAALDVLDGLAPSLAKNAPPSPLAVAVPPGAILLARATRLAEAELPFKSPPLTQSRSISLAMGEDGGELFVEAELEVKAQETAEQVRSILEGVRAAAELQRGDDPGAVRLIKRFKVSAANKAVKVEFRASAAEVWAQLEKDLKHAAQPAGTSPTTKHDPPK